ncbi:MAG: RsmE family RNA methyltransferase [Candidatus Kapaibacteriales bacterium]
MICFYHPDFNKHLNKIVLSGDEFKHFRALRLNKQEIVAVVNGKGLAGIGYISQITKSSFQVEINTFVLNFGEYERNISIAVGILDNKERFEFAYEKAVELRVKEFFPLISKFTQRKEIDVVRLFRKGISAIKQTGRSILPVIYPPILLKDLVGKFNKFDRVIIADRSGDNFEPTDNWENCLVIVGPEGGFDKGELNQFKNHVNVEIVSLGEFKLRTETAVTIILGTILL